MADMERLHFPCLRDQGEARHSLAVLALAAVHDKGFLAVVTLMDTKIHMADKPERERETERERERERERG